MIQVTKNLLLNESEIEMTAVRSQGAGGQNVNKVATAVHLRFDINSSSLPDEIKERIFLLKDKRVTDSGIIIMKAQRFRTQEKNREDAVLRLVELIRKALVKPKKRKATKPSQESKMKRIESKKRRGEIKSLRSSPKFNKEGD